MLRNSQTVQALFTAGCAALSLLLLSKGVLDVFLNFAHVSLSTPNKQLWNYVRGGVLFAATLLTPAMMSATSLPPTPPLTESKILHLSTRSSHDQPETLAPCPTVNPQNPKSPTTLIPQSKALSPVLNPLHKPFFGFSWAEDSFGAAMELSRANSLGLQDSDYSWVEDMGVLELGKNIETLKQTIRG